MPASSREHALGRWRPLLFALLAIACVLRVWLVWTYNPMDVLSSDPERHWLEGTRPLDTSPMAAVDPIVFQLYVGILAKLTVGQRGLVAFWTSLLSLVGPWLWYRFLRELLRDRDLALVGWVVLAALPSWSAIYSYFMQETLMLPLLGLALWATWRARRRADTASFVAATAAWLLAGLTRGICLPLGGVALAGVWWTQGRAVRPALSAALLVALVALPLSGRSWYLARLVSPWGIGQMVALYHLSGAKGLEMQFTRRGGAEHWFYVSMSPAAEEQPLAPLSDWRSLRDGVAVFRIDLDAGQRDWQAAREQLPPLTPTRWAWLTGDNLIRLMFGSSWPDTDLRRPIGRANRELRWVWVPMALACAVQAARRPRRQSVLLIALMVTWFVVQGLFPLAPSEGRYRKPFEGLLIAHALLALAARRRTEPAAAPALA